MTERAFWLAWRQMPRVGATLIMRLQQQFGSLEAAWEADAQTLGAVPGFGPKTLADVLAARDQYLPMELYAKHCETNPNFWTPTEPSYPLLLKELSAPPALLYFRGTVDLLENVGQKPAIAIVGTRHPTEYGLRWTQRLSASLAKRGFTIVSGLADGIDTAAHRACLEAGGRTIAVVGTGVDRVYPARNRQLCEAILEQGLVVSEYPAGTRPDRSHFPQRNRIIAGLCRATIVVEAPKRSGALITAYAANEFGRDVYVVPGSLDQPKMRGGLELINQGAQLVLDESQLLTALGALPLLDSNQPISPMPGSDVSRRSASSSADSSLSLEQAADQSIATQSSTAPQLPLDLKPELAAVLQQLPIQACSLDWLVSVCEQSAGELSSALLQLELMGLVVELPGKYYQRC